MSSLSESIQVSRVDLYIDTICKIVDFILIAYFPQSSQICEHCGKCAINIKSTIFTNHYKIWSKLATHVNGKSE